MKSVVKNGERLVMMMHAPGLDDTLLELNGAGPGRMRRGVEKRGAEENVVNINI
eukprot:CAMPEP_0194764024 /NCGR_PEP_ID=MMETSP0323_2-20130528/20887_1 /TAXON_ID=2866 ORGANISM="Crypthecodinium cohnii, Strain Seligo" /NCGR_SAMPLE_ID=MMETSP0323_2 /ASSEMBLY_ACC=CAM_ASM_000346 /LENGTH=53 /DNA_ID=CAMNT_0039690183 /DNA_START=88 /DNA_END=246 /DNA_ORIENTATION=+